MKRFVVLCIFGILCCPTYAQSAKPPKPPQQVVDRARVIREAMRRGVVQVPMVIYPDDYINPGSKTDRTLPEELQPVNMLERLDCVVLDKEQITLGRANVPLYAVTGMENRKEETFVTFSLPIFSDIQWHAFNKNRVMMDPATGDKYYPRRIDKNIPFDKVLIIKNQKGMTLNFTMVFPRLNDGVQRVIFTDMKPIQTELPLNRAPRRNLVVDNVPQLLENSQKKGRDIF